MVNFKPRPFLDTERDLAGLLREEAPFRLWRGFAIFIPHLSSSSKTKTSLELSLSDENKGGNEAPRVAKGKRVHCSGSLKSPLGWHIKLNFFGGQNAEVLARSQRNFPPRHLLRTPGEGKGCDMLAWYLPPPPPSFLPIITQLSLLTADFLEYLSSNFTYTSKHICISLLQQNVASCHYAAFSHTSCECDPE